MEVRQFLPLPKDKIEEAVCALFVGADTPVSGENIANLHPILVSKRRVCTLLDFLVHRNLWYRSAGVRIGKSNLNDLYAGDKDSDFLSAVNLNFLAAEANSNAGVADYTDCADLELTVIEGSPPEHIIEAVGYTSSNVSPSSYWLMKATALTSCLDGKHFLQLRTAVTTKS
ncbi:hypothetical protein SERLA73DRAFT_80146 [Serpula lacrymans var. lacrymans S7.3]|uniref:DUF6570 domain-containing protein n=1 Tax=Serpula lacrymans var. lacrymans (strain S7.3) TaxID=936435 RepID=F8QIV4_SERL3|nr:hypothetical protein SERLA73DRAFT_80146 [Serpula lacrymans var. lacrymans S7.3]